MGIFDKFKAGLSKTRALISKQLQGLKLQLGKFDFEQLDELEYSLIRTDMGAQNVDAIMENLKQAMQQAGNADSEFIRNNLTEQLLAILGPKQSLHLANDKLNVLLMIGVNGAGKTTTCGKLAQQFSNAHKQVLLCAADTFRAAAIEQLEVWAKRANVKFICQKEGSDPAAVVFDAMQSAQAKRYDVLLVDTAGRLHNKKNLMLELEKIKRVIAKTAVDANIITLLVIDALNGQNALSQAKTFAESCPIDGFVLTKLDGSGKGGVAIALAELKMAPIIYAGVGEAIDDLIEFEPSAFVAALLPEE